MKDIRIGRPSRIINLLFITLILLAGMDISWAGAIIANHASTDIHMIPQSAIEDAKASLIIAYGHTSHGSQITSGMSGLVGFMNGLGYPEDLYAYNSSGSGGALCLRDNPFSGASDLGNPDRTAWNSATRAYLNAHPEVNVVIWSWCGQVSDATETDINTYLSLMNALEIDYPSVQFVYMTGHLDGSGLTGNLHLRNEQIRDFCMANNKILFDFADIESYDPGRLVNYNVLLANDACDYDGDYNGTRESNWAIDWQNTHTLDVDWYSCASAHSQPLNANLKAYAAWWLWVRLAGWNACTHAPSDLSATADSILGQVSLTWNDHSSNEDSFLIQRQLNGTGWNMAYATVPADTTVFTDTGLGFGTYQYRIVAHRDDDGSGNPCDSGPSNTASANIAQSIPAAPSTLVSQVDHFDIQLSWTDNSDNEDAFVVERSIDGGTFSILVANLAPNTPGYTDTNLPPLHTYAYRVKAVNSLGDSGYSNETSQYLYDASITIRLENDVAGEIIDAFLLSATPDTNYGATAYETNFDRFIVQFNLPTEVMDKKIISAELGFFVWAVDPADAGTSLALYRVIQPWVEASVTWNSAETGLLWATPGADVAESVGQVVVENLDHGYLTPVNITGTVQQWVDDIVPNYGLVLDKGPSVGMGIKASEYSVGPYLEITYTQKTCMADIDFDNDVDGMDLALFVGNFEAGCLETFASAYGR
ncbi:MAG: DNRLRE domain-containing protein [Desulfatitalea sp.]|nr:DNRLRE domain-containing protein [Desulfatitalea sp.]NNK00823.1 DNRLRE domain-containing protein [Desulfatitalea sp.]